MKPLIIRFGGKRLLRKNILPLLPTNYGTYHEPFFGGGALFFGLRPSRSYISDMDPLLIKFYMDLKDNPVELSSEFAKINKEYRSPGIGDSEIARKKYFINIKDECLQTDVRSSAVYLFLNKVSVLGKVILKEKQLISNTSDTDNKRRTKHKHPLLPSTEDIKQASILFQNTHIELEDYQQTFMKAKDGDLVYFDPPYIGKNNTLLYGCTDEPTEIMDELLSFARRVKGRIFVAISNSYQEEIKRQNQDLNLYPMSTMYGSRQTEVLSKELFITNFDV